MILVFITALYLALLIPDSAPPVLEAGEKTPFSWNQDEYWSLLESRFQEARETDCLDLSPRISAHFSEMDSLIIRLQTDTLGPDSYTFDEIEKSIFDLAVLFAACPNRLQDYVELLGEIRTLVKNQSIHWDMNSRETRDRIYRLLYGGRIAVEEVMLQSPRKLIPEIVFEYDEPSVTPSQMIYGVEIHSGDILISRGGAPTSALISRGSDYPGNFSHAALVHIDDVTGEVSVVEAHIEGGVVISSVDDYINDTKLRIMVLRLRSDLPPMRSDPMLPHKAAEHARHRAEAEHIPYDFAMNSGDSSKLFCSEVVLEAYERMGVRLWKALSHISKTGLKSWLYAFGVRNFTTQEPSDLEYDPQLRVVAEWRDFETLYKDRIDNAVVDAMLEGAEKGDQLEYELHMLPVARLARAYSVILNQFGGVGPVPEGMSATAALRNEWFSCRHREIKDKLLILADDFESNNKYPAPYWKLVKLAKQAYSE
jgi:hypothetical protein